MRPGRRNRGQSPISQRGFTYVALLIAVAVGGAVLAAVGELASHAQQREKEAELLFIGHEYRQAIAAYYERSPGGAKAYPKKLEDLLEDKRYPVVQRYLRKLYPDPVAGKDWGLVAAPGDSGVMGVYSVSEERPVKSAEFDKADEAFKDMQRYADWQFLYSPPATASSANANSPSGAAPGR